MRLQVSVYHIPLVVNKSIKEVNCSIVSNPYSQVTLVAKIYFFRFVWASSALVLLPHRLILKLILTELI